MSTGHDGRVERALRVHGEGRLDEAEQLYLEVLAESSAHADALHFFGVLLAQRGNHAAALGLAYLIAETPREYEEKALALAHDPKVLASLKERLSRNRDTHPLFDTKRLARHIETAYGIMHERCENGLLPEGFAVPGD